MSVYRLSHFSVFVTVTFVVTPATMITGIAGKIVVVHVALPPLHPSRRRMVAGGFSATRQLLPAAMAATGVPAPPVVTVMMDLLVGRAGVQSTLMPNEAGMAGTTPPVKLTTVFMMFNEPVGGGGQDMVNFVVVAPDGPTVNQYISEGLHGRVGGSGSTIDA